MPPKRQKNTGTADPSVQLDQVRAEADAAIEQARQAHAWLRDAFDFRPQRVVFLDA